MEVVENPLRHALRRRVFIVALTLFGTACQDAPTSAPPVPGRGVTATQPNGRHLGQVSFLCTVGNRALSAPKGWQTRQDTFYFSRGDLDARGRTVQYMYRRKATDGTPLVSVDCTVPYTESALRRVDRWLGVEANGSVTQFKAREEMVTIQGCVGDGVCTLDPLVVTPPPTDPCSDCEPPPPPRPSGGTGGTGGDGWGGGGDTGGDGGSDSGAPYIGTDEETEGSCPQCGEKDALVKQQETINEAIGKVQCESMKTVLRERLPYMKVFTEQPAHLQGPGRKDLGYHADGVIYIYEGSGRMTLRAIRRSFGTGISS